CCAGARGHTRSSQRLSTRCAAPPRPPALPADLTTQPREGAPSNPPGIPRLPRQGLTVRDQGVYTYVSNHTPCADEEWPCCHWPLRDSPRLGLGRSCADRPGPGL